MPNGTLFEAEYERGAILGRGASGVAFLVRPRSHPDVQYVAKEMCVVKTDEKRRKEAFAESQLLRTLCHNNIVACYDVIQDGDMMYIVMEYADGGDLSRRIQLQRNESRRLSEHTVMSVFVQICDALRFLHSRKILHRDLKPANIFIVGEAELADCVIKLGDFGISKMIEGTMGQANSTVGTPSYLSPEICKNNPYGMKADVWSLGVVLYELTCLKVPFHAGNLPAMALMICTSEPKPVPEEYGTGLADLIKSLLQKDPSRRPQVGALLQQPYVQGFLTESLRNSAGSGGGGGGGSTEGAPQAVPSMQPAAQVGGSSGSSRGTSMPSRQSRAQDSGSSRLPSCGPQVRRRPNFPLVDSDACQWAWQRPGESVPMRGSKAHAKGKDGPTPRAGVSGGTASSSSHARRSDRAERGGQRSERGERLERPERIEQQRQADSREHADPFDRHADPPDRTERPERPDRPEKVDHRRPPAGPQRFEKHDRSERADRRLPAGDPDRPERSDRLGRLERAQERGVVEKLDPERFRSFEERRESRMAGQRPPIQPLSGFVDTQDRGELDNEAAEHGDRVDDIPDAGLFQHDRVEDRVTPQGQIKWHAGDMNLESVAATPEHNGLADTDEFEQGIHLAMAAEALHAAAQLQVPPPAETFQEPSPPGAEPPSSSSMITRPYANPRPPRNRLRGRPKPSPQAQPVRKAEDAPSPSREAPAQRGSSAPFKEPYGGEQYISHQHSLASRSVSPHRGTVAQPEAAHAPSSSTGAELPVPQTLRSSGSAPSLPPLPKLLAPGRPSQVQRSRSVAGLNDGRGYQESFQPMQRGQPMLFRTAPLPISADRSVEVGGPLGGTSQGPLPPAPPAPQPPLAAPSTRQATREDSAAVRLAAKLPTADGRHWREPVAGINRSVEPSTAVREGWGDARDADGRLPIGAPGRLSVV